MAELCFNISSVFIVICLYVSANDSRQHLFLTRTPQVPSGLLEHIVQVVQQFKPVERSFPLSVPIQSYQLSELLDMWDEMTHPSKECAASTIQASLLGSMKVQEKQIILYFRKNSCAPHQWTSRNFTKVESPRILFRFVSHPQLPVCVTNKFTVVSTSYSLGPSSIMLSALCISGTFCRRDRWSRSFWTKLWLRERELIYPWGQLVKGYCWPCQLKANCFLWSVWTGIKEQAFSRAVAAYHVPRDVLICSIRISHLVHQLQLVPLLD